MGLTDSTGLLVNSPIEKIYNKVNELDHRYKERERRMIIVPSINHTHFCDIFEYNNKNFNIY